MPLKSSRAHIDSQIYVLSGHHRVTPSTTVQHTTYSSAPSSIPYRPRHTTKRNPTREGSEWQYYVVKTGLEGDDVYSSWHQAYSYCWDPVKEYFFPGSFCKEFNDCDRVWDFLLGVNPESTQTQAEHEITVEPPELNVPTS